MAPHHTGAKLLVHMHAQPSPEPGAHVGPVQYPYPPHYVQSTGLNEAQALGRSPPPTPAV